MTTRILLVTTAPWTSAYRLAAAFGQLGAHVEALYPSGHALAKSRFVGGRHRYRALWPLPSLANALTKAAPDLVVPCDDRAVALLSTVTGFEDLIRRSLGPTESYRILMARTPSMTAALQEGILTPQTAVVESLAALPQALQAVGLPCVLKSDFSWGGDGVRLVGTRTDAVAAFKKLQGPPSRLRSLVRVVHRNDWHHLTVALKPKKAVVNIQAMVEGKPATSVFAAKDGRVLAAQHMDVETWHGTTGPACLMRRVLDPAMDAAAAKIAARFNLSGLHGLDFVRDQEGRVHLIEVNPRVTQICHLALDGDLPAALLNVARRPPVTDLAEVALFPQLMQLGDLPKSVFCDFPYNDPAVLASFA